ncbi:lantibiotic dehydratase [Pseudoduganella flava]|uniref:lantibiotic dehydratase n=1 Tax=Pseudoduganella flava TaxID=871742 RepID=UPI001303E235|nr:lantibiotic dehydratase [Pseudoduganella flava]
MSNIALKTVEPVGHDRDPDRISTVLSPLFLFRLAGLPLAALGAIESCNVRTLVERIDGHQATLQALAEPLSAQLHGIINVLAKDDALRTDMRELIELKRAVHNGRAPKRAAALDVARRYLDGAQAAQLDAWAAAAQGQKDSLAGCADALAQDLEASRVAIHGWANRPVFQRALQIANAQLEEKLDRYFARPEAQITHKHRLLDNALFGYFLRACTKTSPFSTFGIVSHGLWSDLPAAAPAHLAQGFGYRTRTRLNAALLARMASSIAKAKIARATVELRLNPTALVNEDRVHFLRLRSRPLSRLMAFGSLTSHGMFSIALTDPLRRMLELLRATPALPFRSLVEALAGNGQSPGEVTSWLMYLLDVGLVESTDTYDAGSYRDLLEHVRRGAAEIGADVLTRFVERADAITGQMDTDDVARRRELLGGIAAAVGDLETEADGLQLKLESSTIFYEDAALDGGRHGLPFAGNAELIGNLKTLQQLQPVFDVNAPLRAALAEYFKKRFGAGGVCTDVPRFSEEFARECAGPFQNVSAEAKTIEYFDASFDTRHSANIRASRVLHSLRNLTLRHLRSLGRAGGTDEMVIDPARLAALRSQMPTRLHGVYSGSLFMQPCAGDARQWVLNKVYGGSGQLMSRLLYLWQDDRDDLATRTLRAYIAANVPPDTVVAELPGNGDSNLNFHPVLVDHVIGGAPRTDGPHERVHIPLAELLIRHDPPTDTLELVSARDGRRVLPVYLGGLVSELLPDVQKMLLLFGVATSVSLPSWDRLFHAREVTAIDAYPRVRVGNVVVLRRMWAIAPALVPRRAPGESDAELYLRTRNWCREHGVPARSYITFTRTDSVEANQRKPMFFDLASIRSLLAFQKELEKHEGVLWLAEPLPDPVPDGARHHCEYIFDLTSITRS